MNVKNILFATDLSEASQAALEYASTIAHDTGAKLYIAYVGHYPVNPRDGSALGLATCGYTPDSKDWQEVRNQLSTIEPTISDVRCEHRYLEGDPADEIVDFARRQNVDLIVMGTHGRTGLNHLRLGSVAEAVIRRASSPVLTVKQPAEEPQPPVAPNAANAPTC